MTLTSWLTTATVPPGPWAVLVADMSRLLELTAAGGATVTGPGTMSQPVLDAERIAFVVTTPGGAPLSVTFTRAAGTGEVVTNAPHTDGLVLVAVQRAARHWGPLLSWTSDARTASRAAAEALQEALFAPDDRAVAGTYPKTTAGQLRDVVDRAVGVVVGGTAPDVALLPLLEALLAELGAERAGMVVARQLLTPAPTPLPPAPPVEVPVEDPPASDEDPVVPVEDPVEEQP